MPFTPGPWQVRHGQIIWREPFFDESQRRVNQPVCDASVPAALTEEEKDANANLIAAAPDLHGALKTFWDFFNQEGNPYHIAKYNNRFTVGEQEIIDKMFAKAAAALAKAVP